MEAGRGRWTTPGICAALAVMVFVTFGRTVGNGFVNYDDNLYVYDNTAVSRGLSWQGLRWALTHFVCGNWHPLTMLSHMLDCQVYGLWAGGHHLTSVLIHAVCAVLLFLTLREMTGEQWRSAFVAALFAIHPLRVESVAWISERKDVLSGVFFMLTLWAYTRYVRERSVARYLAIGLWLSLGLMSKPMLVTAPFLLLLLDYWPLARLRQPGDLPRLILEKIPLIMLAAAACVMTLLAQRTAMQTFASVPLGVRIGNAAVASVVYLGKFIVPARLAAMYPIPIGGWAAWAVMDAMLLMAGLTTGVIALRRRAPALFVGWLWYLGMLVPVLGILQVGNQAYADRYTYLPEIGLCLAGTWVAADWARDRGIHRMVLPLVAAAWLGVLMTASYRETGYWRDSFALWTHTLADTEDNSVARTNLGALLMDEGRVEEAIAEAQEAVRINPENSEAHGNLGNAYLQQGRYAEAAAEYRAAILIRPGFTNFHNYLGYALFQQGLVMEATAEYREALRCDPENAEAHANLANALLKQGLAGEAIPEYREALRLNPRNAPARGNLGTILLQQGRVADAIAEFREASRSDPAAPWAHNNLALALFGQGDGAEGIAEARRALALQPADASIQCNLAWMLATAPQTALRDGPEALRLALEATKANGKNPSMLRVLAAAYAQQGQFSQALSTARKALTIAQNGSDTSLVNRLRAEIARYMANHSL
jgi:Flp pilus assembly protein TadD